MDEEAERALLLLDGDAGACRAMLPGCLELGYWKPFYQGYVCRKCIDRDSQCVQRGHLPPWWANASGEHVPH